MNELVAITDIDEMDGKFKKGERFAVTDERAQILTRQGKAKHAGDPTLADETPDAAGQASVGAGAGQFNVPPSPQR